MNQEKIGKFIAECRKENGYTQAKTPEQKEKEYFQSQNDKIDVNLQ